ncbi:MAG: DUF6470 family protein [Vulcanibacillus sp.]
MNQIPQIQIGYSYPKIGLNIDNAKLQVKQNNAEIDTHQEYPKVNISTTPAKINIDQSAAFKALGNFPQLEWLDVITDNYLDTGLNSIKEIAGKGEHFQKVHIYNDPIVEHAKNDKVDFSAYDYVGRASCDNVNIQYQAGSLSMSWSGGDVNMDVQVNKPQLDYVRGKIEIYELQKSKVDVIPPKIDLTI